MATVDFFETVEDNYGVEENGLLGVDDYSGVEVPEVQFELTAEQLANMQQRVNPLRGSDNYGIDLYEETLHFLSNLT